MCCKNFLGWVIFVLFLCALGGKFTLSQELIDEIVAIVDRKPILLSEVKLQAQYLALDFKIDPEVEPERYRLLLLDVLQREIDKKVLIAKAIEDSVVVTDEEVNLLLEQRIYQLVNQLGSEEEVEERFGYSIRELKKTYREEIRDRELIRRLYQSRIQQVKITPEEVDEYYEAMKDSLPEIPEQYNISHILLEVSPGEEVIKNARARADSLRKRILAGEDFNRLAELYSDDRGSARDGGRLGNLKRGELGQQNFEEALFVLKPNMVSEIVRTPLGFHIIKMLERRGERVSAQHILISAVATKEDEKRIIENLWELKRRAEAEEDFTQLALEHSDDPEAAENKSNLGWVQLDKVAIAPFAKVIPNLKPGEISAPFKTSFGYHIIRLNAMKPRHRFNLEDDRESIKQMALQNKGAFEHEKWLVDVRKNTYTKILSNF